MLETIWIAFAFFLGLLVRAIGLPPLIGYLAAGFAISASSGWLDIPAENGPILQYVSHLGVLLLLFSVGLKLRARTLLRPEVLGTGILHFAITCALLAPVLYWTLDITPRTALL
ncbi:MAG: cation:proton antiporter, partial [Spongiibacteraceae bacterium]|nr:cation:proton antiporter [Spongiibacteraceae bacterium]